jgi:hypothetical protein
LCRLKAPRVPLRNTAMPTRATGVTAEAVETPLGEMVARMARMRVSP